MKRLNKVLAVTLCLMFIISSIAALLSSAAEMPVKSAAEGPANPNASQGARNILNYLRDLSVSEKTMVGVFNWPEHNGFGGNSPEHYKNHDKYVKDKYGFEGGIIGLHFPMVNNTTPVYEWEDTVESVKKAWEKGQISLIHFSNQWEYVFTGEAGESGKKYGYQDLSLADQDMFIRNFDATVEDRNMDVYNDYMKIVKQWGDCLEKLKDAGVPVLFRPYGEMTNHPCFRTYTDEGKKHFKNIWRQLFNYLTKERGLDNLLFGMAPLIPGSKGTKFDTDSFGYYPGDDVVDFICPTMYPNGGNGLEEYWQWGFEFSKYMSTGKPFGISELGLPSNADHTTSLPCASMRADYKRFLDVVKQQMPRTCFMVLWTDTLLYPSAINSELFLNDERVISLEDMPDLSGSAYQTVGDVVTYSEKNYTGSKRQTLSDGKYSLSQMKAAGFDPAKAESLHILGDRSIVFYKEKDCKGKGWMFIGSIPSLSAYGYDGSQVKSVEIKPISREQISIGKPATASSMNEDAFCSNDGDWTYWSTDEGFGSWITIDLQGTCLINRWKVEHGNTVDLGVKSNTKDYRLQYSMDGQKWQDADIVMGNWYDSTTRDFTQVKAKYVRLYIDTPNSETNAVEQIYAYIADWGVYGVQLTHTLPVSDSTDISDDTVTDTDVSIDSEDEPAKSGTPDTEAETKKPKPDKKKDSGRESSSSGIIAALPWIIGGAALLIIGAGAAVIVIKRRKKLIK